MEKVNLDEKFSLFSEHWSPKIIGALNGQLVKIAKVKGEFVWHRHEGEDELFMVIDGELTIRFRDREVRLGPGEMLIVPAGVEHQPVAPGEVRLLLFEPDSTLNTGDVRDERTVEHPEII